MFKKKSKSIDKKTKEVTFVHTVELTSIFEIGDGESIRDVEEQTRRLEKFLKAKLPIDDATVIKAQVFERELTNEN